MATHLLLLILPLLAISVSAKVFVSIDCGAAGTYNDTNGILWSGDDRHIQTGENHVVPQSLQMPDKVMNTLRVFSSRRKNCYSIGVDKGEKVLVRASFYYGNYDNNSFPPSFDLQLDGNHWKIVVTSSDQLVQEEAIYAVKRDTISVCLAQTLPDQLPFISALEVRGLDLNMYGYVNSSYALFLRRRAAFGTDEIVRYPDDPYDRIWDPAPVVKNYTTIASKASFISTNDSPDNPPISVLQTAKTPINSSGTVYLATGLSTVEVPVYINWYFSEVFDLTNSTKKRSFVISKNDEPISDPIIPPYKSVVEMYIYNITASSRTQISLVPTSDSTLPPLINALEVFQVSNQLTDGTDSRDVQALVLLQNQFARLKEWSGDPCLPASFTWDWLVCSSDETPRVTALNLNGYELSGSLPNFSSMGALQTIDLHNNSLTGEIPAFLGSFPSLKELNLADNNFSESIPSSLSNNCALKLVVSGNLGLLGSSKSCNSSDYSPPSGAPVVSSSGKGKKSGSKLPAILGATISAFILVWY